MKKLFVLMFGCFMAAQVVVFADMECEDKMSSDCDMHGKGKKECPMDKKSNDMQSGLKNINIYLRAGKQLNLTAEQKTTLEQIRGDFKKDSIQKKADLKVAQTELQEIMKKETPDFAASREKIKQISAMREQMKLAMLDASEKGYNVLTEAQKQKLQQIKEVIKERRMKKSEQK